MNKSRTFTLVEMLMVIAVIAVLMGLILPGINMAKEQAKKTRAKAEMNALKIAISQYEATYGYLPVKTGTDVRVNDTENEYDRLIAFLSQTDKVGNTYKGTGNLRGIKLLDVNKSGFYQDPWGENYWVVLDADYDGSIASNVKGMAVTVPSSVVIWSKGPDKKDDANASSKDNQDNLYSAETEWKSGTGHALK